MAKQRDDAGSPVKGERSKYRRAQPEDDLRLESAASLDWG